MLHLVVYFFFIYFLLVSFFGRFISIFCVAAPNQWKNSSTDTRRDDSEQMFNYILIHMVHVWVSTKKKKKKHNCRSVKHVFSVFLATKARKQQKKKQKQARRWSVLSRMAKSNLCVISKYSAVDLYFARSKFKSVWVVSPNRVWFYGGARLNGEQRFGLCWAKEEEEKKNTSGTWIAERLCVKVLKDSEIGIRNSDFRFCWPSEPIGDGWKQCVGMPLAPMIVLISDHKYHLIGL